MKKFISMTLLVIFLFTLIGCEGTSKPSSESSESTDSKNTSDNIVEVCKAEYPEGYDYDDYDTMKKVWDENPVDDEFKNSINSFAYTTASQILKDKDENVMYSPLSLYYALAIVANGSQGDTQKELFDLMNVDDNDYLSQQCGNLYRLLYMDNKVSKLKIANSLWMDNEVNGNKVTFKDDFINNAKENFYASLYSVDFSDEKTGEAIGKWISENTNGTLKYEFNPDPDQIMSIINTVYFYDEWYDNFNEDLTKEDTFYLSDDNQVKCDFMNTVYDSSSFVKGDGYLKSSLGLKNAGSMVFILPDEGVSVNDLISSPEKIDEIFNGGEWQNGQVTWKIPKFKYDTSLDIKETLEALGITAPFDMDSADFTGITDADAYISAIKQKTHIGINEDGVEASAYTEIAVTPGYLPIEEEQEKVEMILDRPFIYGITANNGTLLFVGVCNNPAE